MYGREHWYFAPRAETHDIGGWCVETRTARSAASVSSARPGGGSGGATADTAHALLVSMAAAYRTLDAEHRGERGGREAPPKKY